MHAYLHSTMFIFIYETDFMRDVVVFIYIPLCLYLYPLPVSVLCVSPWFTFHYVYIYMHCVSTGFFGSFIFTFHYVYIYMPVRLCSKRRISIYIPLCLYLYVVGGCKSNISGIFTFHYVYIYICTQTV